MRVDPHDGRCCECGGVLQIVGADDCTMDVECTECHEVRTVEPDAFGDGCMTYYVPFLAEHEEALRDE